MTRQITEKERDGFEQFNAPLRDAERLEYKKINPPENVIDDLITEMAVQSLRTRELTRSVRILGLAFGLRLGESRRRPEMAFLRVMCELIGLPPDGKYDNTRELIKTEFEDHQGDSAEWERLVRGIIGEAATDGADPDKPRFTPDLSHLCESPIETAFYDAAAAIHAVGDGLSFILSPQYVIASYRVDFAIVARQIAVELDGHEYHKSKEQRTSDARRDRVLMLNGWQTMRFTGSEVWKDAVGCVDSVVKLAEMQSLKESRNGRGLDQNAD